MKKKSTELLNMHADVMWIWIRSDEIGSKVKVTLSAQEIELITLNNEHSKYFMNHTRFDEWTSNKDSVTRDLKKTTKNW